MTLEASEGHWTARDEDPPRIFATSVVFDRMAIATTTALALASALLLATETDLFVAPPLPTADRALAGRVDSLTRGVRRRPADLPVWDRAFAGDQLFARDHVFTDQDASAILDLVGGGRLELGENTLVAIDISGPRPVLDVLRGDLRLEAAVPEAESQRPFEVRVTGKPVALAAKGALGVRVLGKEKAEIMVLEGESQVGDTVLKAGQGRRVSETSQAPLAAQIAMLSPVHGAQFYDADVRESGIRFDWQGGAPVVLEIAMDPGFSRGVQRLANATPGAIIRALPPGNYYWRVRQPGRTDVWNETRRLVIHPTPRIELGQPTLGEDILRLLPAGAPRQASVTFKWRSGGSGGPFRIEVASDAKFSKVLASAETSLTRWASPPLAEGEYHWRVLPRNGEVVSGHFRLRALPAPTAPDILAPAQSSSVKVEQPAALTWRPAESAKGYRVEIAKDPDFATPVLSHMVVGTSFEWKPGQVGTYHWRVRAVDEAGRLSPAGETRRLEVEPGASPLLAPPSMPTRMEILLPWSPKEERRKPLWQEILSLIEETAHAEEKKGGRVRWPAVQGATGYVVEIARDASFSSLVMKEQVSEPEVEVSALAPGLYFLRVAATNEAGVPGPYSPPVELFVQSRSEERRVEPEKPALSPPELVSPLDGTVFELKALLPVVSFAWKPVRGAATYQLEIRKNDVNGEVVHERRTRGQDASVELPPARYVWRMRSLRTHGDQNENWSEPQSFEVRHLMPAIATEKLKEPPREDPAPRPEQPAKVELPDLELHLALAPTILAYEETGDDPETKIDAKLFNSLAAGLAWWWSSRLGLGISGWRTATVLFRDVEASHPEGQGEVLIQPFSLSLALENRVIEWSQRGFLQASIGLTRRSLATFTRRADLTLTASHVGVQSPFAALRVGIPLIDDLALLIDVDGSIAGRQGAVEKATLASGRLRLLIGPSDAHGLVGYETTVDRMTLDGGERKIFARTQRLLLGMGIAF